MPPTDPVLNPDASSFTQPIKKSENKIIRFHVSKVSKSLFPASITSQPETLMVKSCRKSIRIKIN